MGNKKDELKRKAEKAVSFQLDDAYFYDDDSPYCVFDGKEAGEIIIPSEYTEDTAFVTDTAPPVTDKVKKSKAPADLKGLLYLLESFTEFIGEEAVSLFKYLYRKLSPLFIIPALFIGQIIKSSFIKLRNAPKKINLSLTDDIKRITFELRAIISAANAVKKRRAFVFIKALSRYFFISFVRHRHFWKTIFNISLPLAAIFAVILTNNLIFADSTFALEVFYKGKSLGYIENTETFEKGRSQALKLLSDSADENAADFSLQPVYRFSRVRANELSNAAMISEGIIASSDTDYIRACGIYINGEFICAVKNEADAVAVFSKYLEPYRKKAEKGSSVSFVEEITYVQGYYREDSPSIWDTAALQQLLYKPKKSRVVHTMTPLDTIASVAQKYNLTISQLQSLNPTVDFNKPKNITSLLISEEERYLRVKVMKTRKRRVSLPFETIERKSTTLSKGTKKTAQKGSKGEKEITELLTYINGKLSYTSFVSEKQTKAPVNKIILIGTRTAPVYSGNSSATGFIWPTRGAYSISSRFGYRNPSISGRGYHYGLDIVKPGGMSTGIPIVASKSGTVVAAYPGWSGYGHYVTINHGGGIMTRYAHMQPGSICVRVGQRVYQGQQIGRIGNTGNSTGPHLHFEVVVNGVMVNPLKYIG